MNYALHMLKENADEPEGTASMDYISVGHSLCLLFNVFCFDFLALPQLELQFEMTSRLLVG